MPSAPSTVVVCAPPGADDSNPPADNETTARTAGGVLSALSDREIACIVVTAASPDSDGLDTLETDSTLTCSDDAPTCGTFDCNTVMLPVYRVDIYKRRTNIRWVRHGKPP
jgi:hypothetical protein